MYTDFYQLDAVPFENTPDPRFFFASEHHREALAAIEYSIRMRKGVVLITGDIGTGKTTVARTMLHRCDKDATIVQLTHGHRTADELLTHILHMLGLCHENGATHAELLESLEFHLQRCAHAGRPVILFIDEAQTLSDSALEELRLISNFDMDTVKLLQLVLIGQPELRDRLCTKEMAPLCQRIVTARRIEPLTLEESTQYIEHRIKTASIDQDVAGVCFESDAVECVFKNSGGVPRVINSLCDHCLLLGMVNKTARIDKAMVQRVAAEMLQGFPSQSRPRLAA